MAEPVDPELARLLAERLDHAIGRGPTAEPPARAPQPERVFSYYLDRWMTPAELIDWASTYDYRENFQGMADYSGPWRQTPTLEQAIAHDLGMVDHFQGGNWGFDYNVRRDQPAVRRARAEDPVIRTTEGRYSPRTRNPQEGLDPFIQARRAMDERGRIVRQPSPQHADDKDFGRLEWHSLGPSTHWPDLPSTYPTPDTSSMSELDARWAEGRAHAGQDYRYGEEGTQGPYGYRLDQPGPRWQGDPSPPRASRRDMAMGLSDSGYKGQAIDDRRQAAARAAASNAMSAEHADEARRKRVARLALDPVARSKWSAEFARELMQRLLADEE